LCTGFLLAIVIIASVTGGTTGGECRGGVDLLQTPEYVSTDGGNWTVIRQCVDGGSRTRELKPGQEPLRQRRP
jgi:hypothetical protein